MTKSTSPPLIARPPLLTDSEADLTTPGVQVVYDPEAAESWGAFEEDALSEADAWDANADNLIAGEDS